MGGIDLFVNLCHLLCGVPHGGWRGFGWRGNVRGPGVDSQPKADQRPPATAKLPEAASVTTDGTPNDQSSNTTVFRCKAPMHKTGHWPVYPRQVRTETLKARPPAGGCTLRTAHSRQALEAPSVHWQQDTGGIPNTYKKGSSDQRPLSSGEVVGSMGVIPAVVLHPSRNDIAESATISSVYTPAGKPPSSTELMPPSQETYKVGDGHYAHPETSVTMGHEAAVSIVANGTISGEQISTFYDAIGGHRFRW